MLPLLKKEIADKKKWATEEELLDYYAIGQVTPGIIAINTATIVGFKTAGIPGAFFATLGIVTPSIIIITIIAAFLTHFAEYKIVQNALWGIRIVAVALIFNTVAGMAKKSIKDKLTMIIFLAGFMVLIFVPLSPVWIVIIAALAGNVAVMKKGEI